MQYFLIHQGAIVGQSDQTDGLPDGYGAIESQGWSWEEVYWDGSTIQRKPDRPSPQHYWDTSLNEWVLPSLPPVPIVPQWEQLTHELRGSALFGKGYEASERTLKANTAFTLLINSLTTTNNLDDLRFAFARLRQALRGIAAIGDFTPEELESIRGKLLECNFDPNEFDLQPAAE